jgi:hypothetical protein
MSNRFEVGKSVNIQKGTELNHGLNEDADSIVLSKPVKAVVVSLTQLKNGGVEIEVPGHEDLSPLFWHQPEVPKRSGRQIKIKLPQGS